MPRFRAVGLAPAATVFTPSRKMAWARTVAVVVPSPATSEVFEATSDQLCADILKRVLRELDFLGDGHAVLGDGGRTELLLDDHVAALGAEGHLDSVRERVHAAQDRLTGIFSVQNLLCHDSFSPVCAVGSFSVSVIVAFANLDSLKPNSEGPKAI
jgi:hypothetical protein